MDTGELVKQPKEEITYQIIAPHYAAGLIVKDGRITEAAPILKWAINKNWAEVTEYFLRKGYIIERV